MTTWYVYILRCADGTLYTGITTDVARRVREHNGDNRLGARYTRARRPVTLFHVECVESRSAAARREAAIKAMPREEKSRLPAGSDFPDNADFAAAMPMSMTMTISSQQRAAFRTLAAELNGIDRDVYADFDRDPLDPIIGLGDPACRIAFFGRDPGRDEVQHGIPFIGAGGQKVRGACHAHLHQAPLADFAASVAIGRHFFWANTVPYKPIGNKAWPMSVKKRFQPLMAELLVHAWHGREVITLGREAFLWFGINQPRAHRGELEAFWSREDRFTASVEISLCAPDGACRTLRLHPLPHPSPLNATWYKRFPELLENRLRQLGARPDNLCLSA